VAAASLFAAARAGTETLKIENQKRRSNNPPHNARADSIILVRDF
jgi:hypothetical protein